MCSEPHGRDRCNFLTQRCDRCGLSEVDMIENPDWLCIPRWPRWLMTAYPIAVGLFIGAILRGGS